MANVYQVELTNLQTGKSTVCRSLREVELSLGRSNAYVRRRIQDDEELLDFDGNRYRAKMLRDEEYIFKPFCDNPTKTQLCWKCKRAYGQCSWSSAFKPVDGWVAVETMISNSANHKVKTYSILECPQFLEE